MSSSPTCQMSDANFDNEKHLKRRPSQTFFTVEKQVEIGGKTIKEIEVKGEKSSEPIDMKKQKKLVRKKSLDQAELNIACRDLGNADFEGWLLKKAGGHGIMPVNWKRYWCVIKGPKVYCYKTSFDIAADYAITIQCYTIETATEKKKIAFRMKPNSEDYKQAIFAGETEDEVNKWIEVLNKVVSGVNISEKNDNSIPDYEDRKRLYSSALRQKDDHLQGSIRKRSTSAFNVETETTGMPAGFGARTSSLSQPRVRKMSSGGSKGETCLAVGSMFKTLEDEEETAKHDDVQLKDLLFKEVAITPSTTPDVERRKQKDLEKLNAEIAKLNADMLVLNKDGERKHTSSNDVSVKANVVPSIEVDELKKEVERNEKEEPNSIDEEHIQVAEKTSQERTTSQIFRDFAEATANDEPTLQLEQGDDNTDVAIDENADGTGVAMDGNKEVKDTVNNEPIIAHTVSLPDELGDQKERPPPVKEDELTESRRSSEIDAETVITELEEQAKKDDPSDEGNTLADQGDKVLAEKIESDGNEETGDLAEIPVSEIPVSEEFEKIEEVDKKSEENDINAEATVGITENITDNVFEACSKKENENEVLTMESQNGTPGGACDGNEKNVIDVTVTVTTEKLENQDNTSDELGDGNLENINGPTVVVFSEKVNNQSELCSGKKEQILADIAVKNVAVQPAETTEEACDSASSGHEEIPVQEIENSSDSCGEASIDVAADESSIISTDCKATVELSENNPSTATVNEVDNEEKTTIEEKSNIDVNVPVADESPNDDEDNTAIMIKSNESKSDSPFCTNDPKQNDKVPDDASSTNICEQGSQVDVEENTTEIIITDGIEIVDNDTKKYSVDFGEDLDVLGLSLDGPSLSEEIDLQLSNRGVGNGTDQLYQSNGNATLTSTAH